MSEIERIALGWDRITEDCKNLSFLMRDAGMVTGIHGFIALARGGLSVAQLLGYYLDVRRIEAITVVGYEDTQKLKEQKLLGNQSPDIGDGEGWIVIDDLVDTGRSYRFVKKLLPKARFVALYAKPEGLPDAELALTTFAQDSWLDFPWEVNPI